MEDRRVTEEEARGIIEGESRKITDADIETVLQKEEEIGRTFRGPLGKFIADGRTLMDMIRDYWKGNYRGVPWWTITAAAAALLYVLNPMDVVPDFIPFVGLVDDATVLSVCLYMLDRDIQRYRTAKRSVASPEDPQQ
jgi:uncharacterized membrane protein YkvA (DUF1232 family)